MMDDGLTRFKGRFRDSASAPRGRHGAGSVVLHDVDEIRERYGSTAITRAVLLGRDQGLTVPLLPD